MRFNIFKNTVLFFVLMAIGCTSKSKNKIAKTDDSSIKVNAIQQDNELISLGANQVSEYLHLLNGKRIGIVANQTSVLKVIQRKQVDASTMGSETVQHHLVDYLHNYKGITVSKVFAPEHGFRGTADAGEVIKDGLDIKTGLPIVSLYGKNKKPSKEQLKDIDIVVFDIQDVGARFYTYISSLHFVMEACAEQNIPILILDRPNPNGHYIDGPILEPKHQSFVGMHPVPIVHGMTIGEYAQMINGEGWLNDKMKCNLTIIPLKNYTHKTPYNLPIKPSPNLPNDVSINLYPSLCFFEGTNVSIGRGTDKQFQVVGSPFYNLKQHPFTYTPEPNQGSKYPKHRGKPCHGYDLSEHEALNTLNLSWLIEFYKANQQYAKEETYFNDFFTKLAGTKTLQQQIEAGVSESEIKASWKPGLDTYETMRQKYLLYK
jgi:uncharacterized protein YbbC (DUF1343 family)